MTAVELARAAAAVIPPARATGWRITCDDTAYAVVPIIDHRLDGAPVFRGSQRDCSRMYRLLTGEGPTPRDGHVNPTSASSGVVSETAQSDRVHRESSDSAVAQSEEQWLALTGPGFESRPGALGDSPLDTHLGPGIKPEGVPANRSSDAPAGSSSDGVAAGSAMGMASASPGPADYMTVASQPADAASLGSGHQLTAFGLPSG